MNRLKYLIIVCLFLICGCKKVDPPIAIFVADKTSITEGDMIFFSDMSQNNPTSWNWTFEGGTPNTSTSKNPVVNYYSVGKYSVALEVANEGGIDFKIIENYITVNLPRTDIKFINNTYTAVSITLGGVNKSIAPSGNVIYYDIEGYSIKYHAETSGKTTQGTQVGLAMGWDYTIDLNGSQMDYSLDIGSLYYFLYITNNGTHKLTPLAVGTQDYVIGFFAERTEYIVIPNDGVKYSIGYYKSWPYSSIKWIRIKGFWEDDPSWYSYWDQGSQFNLPNTTNQSIHLTNTAKKSAQNDSINHYRKLENLETLIPETYLNLPSQNDKNSIIVFPSIVR